MFGLATGKKRLLELLGQNSFTEATQVITFVDIIKVKIRYI